MSLRIPLICSIAWCHFFGFVFGCSQLNAEDRTVDFRNQILAHLTRHGCNAGACHGAALGRGGFKLSLYGSDPPADYDAIVRQVGGRRINLAEPTLSLLLLKATESVEHTGGLRFDDQSESARSIRDWIATGASYRSSRTFDRVEVSPHRSVVRDETQQTQIKAVAHFTDGSTADVTNLTVLAAEDPSAVSIDEDGRATVHRAGRHVVVARYLNEVVPIELLRPFDQPFKDSADTNDEHFIDREINAMLATLRLNGEPPSDRWALRRRLSLNLVGRLPDFVELPIGCDDLTGTDRDAVAAYVDALMQTDAFADYWTFQLASLLRVRQHNDDRQAIETYHRWLRQQVADGFDYREFATALIGALGDSRDVGPANFYRTANGPRPMTEFVSEVFLASRLRCANCHDHPLDHWTQDDYHGIAAIFAKVSGGRQIGLNPRGNVTHPGTLLPAAMRLPNGESLSDRGAADGNSSDPRRQFARWLTSPENPYFANAIVNRLWKHMMGRGLVEPVDDFRATNPATHPQLLRVLAADFVSHGYDLRRTLKQIAISTTFARSGRKSGTRSDTQFYSHRLSTPMSPEVLADAISDVVGVSEPFGQVAVGTRAIKLIDPETSSTTLDVLGRCDRKSSCEAEVQTGKSLAQKLHLLNGPLLNSRLFAKGSRLDTSFNVYAADPIVDDLEIVDQFYRVALSRPMTSREQTYWKQQRHSLEDAAARKAWLEDFVWSLLNSEEFHSIR
ncbi:DUF1553 domain-containing protein [Roseiconus lacunae]|uniref:DUF1553 domain-containing protein n=1 Tax=Roseiconus lacunae TaxID=2605694 RepID=UPI0011F33286|nr:DUF1553 domain-containing protein [Roseiconus lacunae]